MITLIRSTKIILFLTESVTENYLKGLSGNLVTDKNVALKVGKIVEVLKTISTIIETEVKELITSIEYMFPHH